MSRVFTAGGYYFVVALLCGRLGFRPHRGVMQQAPEDLRCAVQHAFDATTRFRQKTEQWCPVSCSPEAKNHPRKQTVLAVGEKMFTGVS